MQEVMRELVMQKVIRKSI